MVQVPCRSTLRRHIRNGMQADRRKGRRPPHDKGGQFPCRGDVMDTVLRHRHGALCLDMRHGRCKRILRDHERIHHHRCHLLFRHRRTAKGIASVEVRHAMDWRTWHRSLLLCPDSRLRTQEQQRLLCRGYRTWRGQTAPQDRSYGTEDANGIPLAYHGMCHVLLDRPHGLLRLRMPCPYHHCHRRVQYPHGQHGAFPFGIHRVRGMCLHDIQQHQLLAVLLSKHQASGRNGPKRGTAHLLWHRIRFGGSLHGIVLPCMPIRHPFRHTSPWC